MNWAIPLICTASNGTRKGHRLNFSAERECWLCWLARAREFVKVTRIQDGTQRALTSYKDRKGSLMLLVTGCTWPSASH